MCRRAAVKAARASSSQCCSAHPSPGARNAEEKTSGTRYPCHNPLLMANFSHKIQEKEFIGSLIWPGCISFFFHAALVEPSTGSARTCNFYPLSKGFQTPQSILESTKVQESHGKVSCMPLHAAEQMPGTIIPSGADAVIVARGRGAAVWASACWRCSWGNEHLIKGRNAFKWRQLLTPTNRSDVSATFSEYLL